jgi:hypothetical protein
MSAMVKGVAMAGTEATREAIRARKTDLNFFIMLDFSF